MIRNEIMRSKLFLILLTVFVASASAQSPSKILKQAEKAMGGAKVLQSTTSWSRSGTIRRVADGVTGRVVMQAMRPNLFNLSFDVGGFEVESGYNGKSGWIRNSRDGLRTLTGEQSVDFQAEAAYRNSLWLDAKKERSKITSGGKSDVTGHAANVVVITTAKGPRISLYFDSSTNLLLAEEFASATSKRRYEYSDYRNVNGLAQPSKMKFEADGTAYEATFDDIRQNAQIARSEFDFPNLSGAPLPDIPTLLKELQANEDKVEALLDTYSYMQRSTAREIGKDGILRDKESETFQLSFYKGYRIRRLVEKNGKPLTAEEQADEDKEAGKRVEEIEKQIAKRDAKGGVPDDESRRISVAEVLRASKLSNPRRERFRGRDVIVFDFEPNPQFDYKNAKSMLKFFGKTAGAMWIDEKDKQVARLEASLADSFNVGGGVVAKLKKGASFTLEQERINDEIWLPSAADISLSVRVLMVKGIDLNQSIRSYDYRKFSTEVKDAKVNTEN
jgi:outer membrane lipoprotein-sorting protein